jgi:acetolactate synthase small subunit
MNIHKDVITEETPIEVGGKNENIKDFINEIENQDIFDVIQALCTEYSIQY